MNPSAHLSVFCAFCAFLRLSIPFVYFVWFVVNKAFCPLFLFRFQVSNFRFCFCAFCAFLRPKIRFRFQVSNFRFVFSFPLSAFRFFFNNFPLRLVFIPTSGIFSS